MEKTKLIIWGMDEFAHILLGALDNTCCDVVALLDDSIDNRENMHDESHRIIPVQELLDSKLKYDYVIVADYDSDPIRQICSENQVHNVIYIWQDENNYDFISKTKLISGLVSFYNKKINNFEIIIKDKDIQFEKAIKERDEGYAKHLHNTLKEQLEKQAADILQQQKGNIDRLCLENNILTNENASLKNRIINAPYEIEAKKRIPRIIDSEKTLDMVINGKSMCRYGDGEFQLMLNQKRAWFQDVDKELATRLKEAFTVRSDGIIIAIADIFGNLSKFTDQAADDIRDYIVNNREEIESLLDFDYQYADAYVSRPYLIYKDKGRAKDIFNKMKMIWKEKRILLVEGKYVRSGINNDLFSGAKSVKRIICPEINAFSYYGEIMGAVAENIKDIDLVLLSLGPTATVLACDIANTGMQAIDFGQVDNEYMWYKMGVQERVPIEGKAVPEIEGEHEAKDIMSGEYLDQIIAKIGG